MNRGQTGLGVAGEGDFGLVGILADDERIVMLDIIIVSETSDGGFGGAFGVERFVNDECNDQADGASGDEADNEVFTPSELRFGGFWSGFGLMNRSFDGTRVGLGF